MACSPSHDSSMEQDTSAQTAPYIEDLVQQIIDAHDGITDQEFFQILFHQPVNSPFQMFLDTNDAQYFHEYVENLIDSDMISGLQIYMDFPPQSVRTLLVMILRKIYFSPMKQSSWYRYLVRYLSGYTAVLPVLSCFLSW